MVKYTALLVYLLFIIMMLIDQQQATPLDFLSREHSYNYPSSSWEEVINNARHRQDHRRNAQYFKRFANDLLQFHQQRRFGNTKYGRSLSNS